MAGWGAPQGPFDIPDVPDWVPRRLKPWLFIFFVLIIQFSGGLYLAAVTDMVGTTALMQEDILMAGYASLIGMSINFCVMFRFKFRFTTRTQLMATGLVLLASSAICANTTSVPVLVGTCLIAGWFRMQGTFACNSTIQLWLTPTRDMSVFFCYVYLVVDGVIQLCGIGCVYVSYFSQWEYMHYIMGAMLCLMMLMTLIFVRPVRCPMYIPLLGIDWIGAILWTVFFMCFTFVCVYGNFYDWWDATAIRGATILGLSCLALNLWRATFLRHPYVSLRALFHPAMRRATLVYMIFFTLMATEHVFEHGYAATILGFDETNLIDLNWYVLVGILAGVAFTYVTFARRKWRYKTMAAIAFAMAGVYLAWFYFFMDYGIEKESLFVPLFVRGFASVIISIVFLTSVQGCGLPFQVFPQSLTINGFTGAVMGACFGPAIVGEWLRHTMAKNSAMLSSAMTDVNTDAVNIPLGQLYGTVQAQSLIVSMKEIYGWLLIIAIISLIGIIVHRGNLRPFAYFPKWRNIRKALRNSVKMIKRNTPTLKRNSI